MGFGRLERTKLPEPMSEINVTPLVDVMLVLVVIFIITAPLLASASLLGRFLKQKQGSEVVMDGLLSAMRLYNDFTFRLKAEEMQKQMATLPASDESRRKLELQVEALNASITETRLRLPQS